MSRNSTADQGDLAGKSAIVTGAASGNGRAIAIHLAQAGAKFWSPISQTSLWMAALKGLTHVATHDFIMAQGGEAAFYKADVSNAKEVEDLVAKCALWGRLDVIVANAGVFCGPRKIEDEPESAWEKTMAFNAKGAWLCSKYACRQMIKQDLDASGSRGRIINIASVGGMIGLPYESSYCMSKGAVILLTRQVALDYAEQGITSNCVAPGFIHTAMTRPIENNPEVLSVIPARRAGEASDIAGAGLYLAGSSSAYVTGVNLPVDGGRTC